MKTSVNYYAMCNKILDKESTLKSVVLCISNLYYSTNVLIWELGDFTEEAGEDDINEAIDEIGNANVMLQFNYVDGTQDVSLCPLTKQEMYEGDFVDEFFCFI